MPPTCSSGVEGSAEPPNPTPSPFRSECSTRELYDVALQNFRRLLLDRIAHHEDEVFAARARFQLRREEDKAHFDRWRRRQKRAEKQKKKKEKKKQKPSPPLHPRRTVLEKFVRSASRLQAREEAAVAAPSDTDDEDEALHHFEAEQNKLRLEHEEDLQQQFPLAFFSEEGAGVMAFSLAPMIQSRLLAIAQARTREHTQQETTSTSPDHHRNHPSARQHGGGACVKEHSLQPKTSQSTGDARVVKDEHPRDGAWDIGRGAYMDSPSSLCEGTARAEGVGAERDDPQGPLHHPAGTERPAWVARIDSHGAAQFAQHAIASMASRHKALWNEARVYVREETPLSQHVESALLSRRLEEAEEAYASVHARMTQHVQHARERLGLLEESIAQLDKGVSFPPFTQTSVPSPHVNGDEIKDVSSAPTEERMECPPMTLAPSGLIRARREERMSHINNIDVVDFSTERWTTIPLDESGMQAEVDAYLWPHQLEERIQHVMRGNVGPSSTHWLALQHRDTEPAENSAVVALPGRAEMVWLRVEKEGELLAQEVHFT